MTNLKSEFADTGCAEIADLDIESEMRWVVGRNRFFALSRILENLNIPHLFTSDGSWMHPDYEYKIEYKDFTHFIQWKKNASEPIEVHEYVCH